MKLLILGGGHCQLNAIKMAKEKGHEVIVSDYLKDSPGKQFCDTHEIESTFNVEGNIKVGIKHNIDGVMTVGTDQPVYTAAVVSEKLGLPSLISSETAKAVTNKKIMKNIFKSHGIPSANFTFLERDFKDEELEGFKFPVVVKPLDSQGQRGVYRLESIKDIRERIDEVLGYSRENEILVEEYYEHEEITVSGWVEDGKTHVLTVTDRITYNTYPGIGVCTSHNFPSKHMEKYYKEIHDISLRIVDAFGINNGPIYFQMLIGQEGIKVNEVACRVGGAYEDELIPLVTGIDILDMVMEASLGRNIDTSLLENYDLTASSMHASVQLLFAKAGRVDRIGDIDEIRKLPDVISGRYTISQGQALPEITNATQRIGYILIAGESSRQLRSNISNVFEHIQIYDGDKNNLIINFSK
ncbi:MAG: ATP-grasp domain-containing protein [Clostridiaceae bacterium]